MHRLELADAHHLAGDADALADEEVEQLLLDPGHPREPLARDRHRAAQPRLEERVATASSATAVVERDQRSTARSCRTRAWPRAEASAPALNRSPSMNGARFLARCARAAAADQRLFFALVLASCARAQLLRAALGEPCSMNTAAATWPRRRRRPAPAAAREADRIEDEHVALERRTRHAAWCHRGDQSRRSATPSKSGSRRTAAKSCLGPGGSIARRPAGGCAGWPGSTSAPARTVRGIAAPTTDSRSKQAASRQIPRAVGGSESTRMRDRC